MTVPAPNAAQPKSRRRWYQFTLGTLLIVVALAGGICSVGVWVGFDGGMDVTMAILATHGPMYGLGIRMAILAVVFVASLLTATGWIVAVLFREELKSQSDEEERIDEKPHNAAPLRWYQFSLRTLMIGVTLLCVIPGGYILWERSIALGRKALLEEVIRCGGHYYPGFSPGCEPRHDGDLGYWIRAYYGDKFDLTIILPDDPKLYEFEDWLRGAFPDAYFF